jgi:nitrate/nitrite transport system substrate-binding protein
MPVRVAGTTMERATMSSFDNPFDPDRRLDRTGCACGAHRSQAEHDDAQRQLQCAAVESEEQRYQGVVASAVMRAVFRAMPRAARFSNGRCVDRAGRPLAVLSREDRDRRVRAGGAIEKKDLKVGFIPITCATPIIMAHPLGFYSKHGLNVEVIKTAGWAVDPRQDAQQGIRRRPHALADAARDHARRRLHADPYTMPAVENINGQAITLAVKHKDKRDPKSWKASSSRCRSTTSMHNYLLRYYVAEHGLDPDTDIQIRAVPPPEMVANLRADNIDGFLGPDPFNQRAVYDGVGFIHLLSRNCGRATRAARSPPPRSSSQRCRTPTRRC